MMEDTNGALMMNQKLPGTQLRNQTSSGGSQPPLDVWFLNWVPGIFWFIIKALFVFFMISMVKAFVPRYRYDQLMRLGWKVFLPISLGMLVIVAFSLKLLGTA